MRCGTGRRTDEPGENGIAWSQLTLEVDGQWPSSSEPFGF